MPDYNALLARLPIDLARTSDTQFISLCPDFIAQAEQRIARDIQLRMVDVETTGTLTAGQDFVALPADCAWPKLFRLDLDPPSTVSIQSRQRAAEWLADTNAERPIVAFVDGFTLKLAPVPTANHPYTLFYSTGIVPLSVSVPTNWLTVFAWDVLLIRAKCEAAEWLGNDERLPGWEDKYSKLVFPLKQQEWRARTGGGTLAVAPGVGFPA